MTRSTADVMPDPAALARWPGRERREPPAHDPHYLALKSLSTAMRLAIAERLHGRAGLAVLDVGCGEKPYLPLLAPYAASYRGMDAVPGPTVDDVGEAEALPYPDDSFDVVLCTQVLEHLREPDRAVREIHRVLRPGGLALVSTHGVFIYHPCPAGSDQDYWRWTHAGLGRLFETSAAWQALDVRPNGEITACVGYVMAQFLGDLLDRQPVRPLGRAVMSTFNRAVERIDRRFPPGARTPRPGSMSANYLLVANALK